MASRSIIRSFGVLRGLRRYAGGSQALRLALVAGVFSAAAFGACTFTVNPATGVLADSLGFIDLAHDPLVIQITASDQSCAWTADATDGFATVSGPNSGTGNGSLTYTVAANNTGVSRSTTLNIAGNAVPLTQALTPTVFSDVLPTEFNESFFDGMNLLRTNNITVGCTPTPLAYCPNANVTRDQMAVFIVRTILGGGPNVDNFTYSTTPYFNDVPPTYQFFKWIQKMRDLGITAGTTATTYSPQALVTRDQMAVFIVRARLGVNTPFTPPAAQQFTDVPPTNNFYNFIQELKSIGITAGCNATQYCPQAAVTRSQMAVFLMRAGFNSLFSASAPLITQVSPTSGVPGAAPFTLTLKGINTHFQQGVTTILAAGGVTFGTPTVTDATDLTVQVTIPAGIALGPITITAQTLLSAGVYEAASSPNIFVVGSGDPAPTITSFSPASGPIGTSVTVTGTTLVSSLATPATVLVPLQGGGLTPAPVTSATATSLTFVIPSTATSGKFQMLTFGGNVTSATAYTVTPSSTYTLTASPSIANVIAGQTTTYTVSLASSSGFTGVAALSVSGLPAGLTSSFNPAQITVGQQSVLTITAPSNQASNSATITVTGAATVDGIAESVSATPTLNVTPISTSFLGRTVIDNTANTSLGGITVTMVGQDGSGHSTSCTGSTTSDASGNFALTNLPSGCLGPQLIGFVGTSGATTPAGTYAGLQLVFTLVSNTVVVSPVLVHLPRIDTAETFNVIQNATFDQTYAFKTIPGLAVTVYKGTTFTTQSNTMPDPFPLAAIEVPVDRLPDVMPTTTASVTAFIVAFQPAESNATQGVAVSFPNTLNTPPGTDVPLMTLNPTLGRMAPYGTGTVSSDGTTIVPDIDPSTGSAQHRYGIVHFDWHGPAGGAPNGNNPGPCPGKGWGGDPVDLSSGLFAEYATDMELRGLFPILIKRTLRNGGTAPTFGSPFGTGGDFNYNYRLDLVQTFGASVINLIMPDGNRYPFNVQGDGTLINTSICTLRGAVMTVAPNNDTTIKFPDGSTMMFTPGIIPTGSLLSSWTEKNGNTLTFTRDTSPPYLLRALTNASGLSLNFTYDSGYHITQITDPIGRTVNYTYNSAGYMTSVTHPDGAKWQYTYDPNNNIATEIDPRNVTIVQNTYDANSRVTKQVQGDGTVVTFAYTLVNALVPTSPVQQTIVTDQNGHSWTHRFNPLGYTLSVIDPLGNERDFTRASGTNFLLSVSGNGECQDICGKPQLGDMTFTYDPIGNLLSVTNAAGGTEQFTYTSGTDFLTSVTNAAGNTWMYGYDSKGNMTSETDPAGGQQKYTYATNGVLTKVTDELGNASSYTYNANGNMISMTDADGNVTQFSYDGVSRMVAIKDPKGQVTQLQYDAKDRLTKQTSPNGQATSFTYDKLGALTSVTDPRGGVTTYTFDVNERVSSIKDANGNTSTYTYDPIGNALTTTDRKGQKTTYTYDALNRRVSETYADGATVIRQFDAAGRVTQENDSVAGVFKNTFDVTGNLTQQITPFGSMSYTRNPVFAVTSRQVTGQPATTYTYDPRGYVTKIANGSNTVQFTYDASGKVTGIARSNGVTTTNTFDAQGNVTAVANANGGTQFDNEAVTYDPLNNVASASKIIAQALTTQSATATYDAANRVKTFGARNITSDANGSRTSDAGGAGGTTNYTWDARNRLTAMTVPANGGTPALTVSYVYDPEGNLIRRRATTANPGAAGGDVITQYMLDENSNVVYQSTVGGEQLNMLTTAAYDAQYGVVGSAGTVGFALHDYMGNIVGNTNSAGALAGTDDYEPFGQTTQTGSSYPFAFQGRIQTVSNLYNFRARYYDPTTGSFISEDPAGIKSDFNFYRYATSNPVTFGDPSGQGISWGGQASAEAEAGIGTGGSAQISAGGGTFVGGNGISKGAWVSSGGFVGGPGAGYNGAIPGNGGGGFGGGAGSGCGGLVIGASASAGFGGWISNAGQPSDLGGTFNQFNFNAGIGPIKGGLSIAWSGSFNPFSSEPWGTFIIGVSPPAAGVTAGISASFYKTNTAWTGGTPPSWSTPIF